MKNHQSTKNVFISAIIFLLFTLFTFNLAFSTDGPIVEKVLPNGLKVLLKEVHTAPLVSVWTFYQVGSKNEYNGITGISHWVEHMNFLGTKKFSKEELFSLISSVGGYENAYTWLDVTAYFSTVPKDKIDLALEYEKEKMHNALYDSAEVKKERSVIISELRGGENDPEEMLDEEIWSTAFKESGYHWPTIGWISDLEKITRQDLYNYYRKHYIPNNATLIVVGDFQTDSTLVKIEKLFAEIPKGETPESPRTVESPQKGEKRIKLKGGGNVKYLEVGYKTPPTSTHDFYPLLLLDAVLTGAKGINIWTANYWAQASKTSRLYKGLVDQKLATKARGLLFPFKEPNLYSIIITLADGVNYFEVEKSLLQEIEKLKKETITPGEFEKVLNQLKAAIVYEKETATDQAHQLGYFETMGSYSIEQTILDSLDQVKPEEIKEVCQKYFGEDSRTVGWYIPTESAEAPAVGVEQKSSLLAPKTYGFCPHKPKEVFMQKAAISSEEAPSLKPKKFILNNGLTVLIYENHNTPSVSLNIDLKAGSMFDPEGKEGLANFVSRGLDAGTANQTKEKIYEGLDFYGAKLEIFCDVQSISIQAKSLSKDYKKILATVADILTNPVFPQEEIEKTKGEISNQLDEENNNTQFLSEKKLKELIYPQNHPFHHNVSGSKETIANIKREDLVSFHKAYYSPKNAVLALVGDVNPQDAFDLLEKIFSKWSSPRKIKKLQMPQVATSHKIERKTIPLSDKTQVDIALGFLGPKRNDPDFYSLMVMNNVLGEFPLGGRLGVNIRNNQGMAYYVYCTSSSSVGQSPWMVRAGVNPQNVDKAVASILEELKKITQEPVTDDELIKSKQSLIAGLALNLETNQDIAKQLIYQEFYNLGNDFLSHYVKAINSVTKDDIKKVARKYLNLSGYKLVTVGPDEKK